MSANLMPFTYDGTMIRTVDKDGEPWFVAKDIADILGYGSTKDLTRRLDDDDKGGHSLPTLGGNQEMTIISEPGLYMSILGSRVEGARKFKRWVTREVLPAIRRHGGYINPDATAHQVNALIRQAQMRMELCQAAKGLVHPDHLEAKARIVLAQGIGEHAELDPKTRPLYVQEFLKSKGVADTWLKRYQSAFGKRVKAGYYALHGCDPETYPLTVSNGQIKNVCAYTEADRPLLDDIFTTHYAA